MLGIYVTEELEVTEEREGSFFLIDFLYCLESAVSCTTKLNAYQRVADKPNIVMYYRLGVVIPFYHSCCSR